ncbi:protein roadkill-like isoform X1 [Schistocerca piceifrons]|uniref:protein roadkill-like isoform X1 n=1 Tax=Schistocerca piceifrons TaxID=274613 RepID=UPI001F5E6419|nr:protein roadkill-like isoform X1 [Schistocerca piceifrons]
MFCRGFSWFVRIFVAVVISTGCSHPVSVTEFYTEVTAHSLTTNKEALTVGRVQEAEEATAEDLGALLDAGDGAVVTLLAGDTRLVAHRAVLAARSPVFAGMLRRLTLEASSSSQLTLSDTEGPVLRQVLAYLYTLQPLQLPSMAPQLMVAADKYGLSVLKAHCEQQVASQLSVETAAATGVLAIRHSANMLKQAAVAFIKSHLLRVVATQGWGEAVVNDPQTVVELTHLIAETPTDTSTPSAGESRTGPSSQPHSGHSDDGRSPATAVPPTSPQATPQPDDAADSHLRHPSLRTLRLFSWKTDRWIRVSVRGSDTTAAQLGHPIGSSAALQWPAALDCSSLRAALEGAACHEAPVTSGCVRRRIPTVGYDVTSSLLLSVHLSLERLSQVCSRW